MWFNSKYETNTSTCWCLNDSPGNGRWACPRFLGRAFIYLFVDLFTFLGWMVEAIFCLKLAGETALSECRTKVDAGTEEQSAARSGAGHSHGLHARVWKVGDQTEGRTKCWRLRLFALVLGHGRMIIELFRHPKKKNMLSSFA